MQRCRPRARGRAGAPPTWATQTLGFLISGQAMSETRIGDRLEHEFCQKKSSQPVWRQAHLARSPESQPPVCVARRAIGRGQCECPVPSPRVFLHRFPLCSTRGTSAKKKRRTSQAADGRTDGRTDGRRGRRGPFYLDSYVSTAVPCSVLLAPSLPPPWFVRRTSLDRRPSVCAAAAAAHEFSPARGGNEGAAPHRGQLRSALWIVI